jgi:hypothetical protein
MSDTAHITAQRHDHHIEARAANTVPRPRRVMIESPFAGAVDDNRRYARACMRAPFAIPTARSASSTSSARTAGSRSAWRQRDAEGRVDQGTIRRQPDWFDDPHQIEHNIADERAVRWRLALVGCGQRDTRMALAPINSVQVTVSTICGISFVCSQARIETE